MVTAHDLKRLLLERHAKPVGEWAVFTEVNEGTGAQMGGRIDVAAFNCWPSGRFTRLAYEVKVSRGDWLRELAHPAKRAWAEEQFNECYFVCALGVAGEDEVPDGWGLMTTTKAGDKLRRVKVARWREVEVGPALIASVIRQAHVQVEAERTRIFRWEGEDFTAEDMKKVVDERVLKSCEYERERLKDGQSRTNEEFKKLHAQRQALEAPLRALAKHASTWFPDYKTCTVEDVEQWVGRVRAEAFQPALRHVEEAHAALGLILGKTKAETARELEAGYGEEAV